MNNLLSDGVSSETIFCTTVPSRIFLCDVIKFATQQNNSDRLFRLMGTIVEIIPQNLITDEGRASSSTTCGDDCSPANKLLFVIDDGSGTVAVFTERKTDTAAPMLSSPPSVLKVGLTVDCIGKLVVHGEERLSDDGQSCSSSDKQQDKSPHIWLVASSVSIVTSPQEALLRQIELTNNDSNNLRNNTNTESNSTISTGGKLADENMPRNRILLAGDLNFKLNSIFYNSSSIINNNNNRQQQLQPQRVPEIIFKPDDAFRFIRYSKDEGGISIDDLALLVGAAKAKEKRAVKAAVEYLQNQGMVYLKQGKYYPL